MCALRLLLGAALLAAALPQAAAAGVPAPAAGHGARPAAAAGHLEIMSFYGMSAFNLGQMKLGKQGGGGSKTPWVTHMLEGSFAEQVQVYREFKIPSFYGDMSSHWESPTAAAKIFLRGAECTPPSYPVCRLGSEWEPTLEALVSDEIGPGLANGTLVGVFLGDELCCEDTAERTGMQCWESVIAPVADKLRSLLGPKALIYTNECGGEQMWNSSAIKGGWKIPSSLDIVSTDYYAGWLPPGTHCPDAGKCAWCPSCPCFNTSGLCPQGATDPAVSEVSHMKAFIEQSMLPAMHAHQKILTVPGTFACHAADSTHHPTPMSNASSAAATVQRLDAWMSYARTQERIVGFNPWHFNNREVGEGVHGAPCDMNVGAVAMPSVVAKLAEMGREIQQQQP